MRIRSSHLATGVKERQTPPAASTGISRHRVSVPRVMTSPRNDATPRAVGARKGDALLVKQRVQAAVPQLQCVPSD